MAAVLPSDVSVVLTLAPDLSVQNITTSQIDFLVGIPDYPIVMAFDEVKGDKGDQGETGTPGPSGMGINWMGVWSATTAYVVNEAVERNGSSYICVQANTGHDPVTATTYWNLMAQQGAAGATGSPGSPGNPGAVGPPGNTGATGQGYTWRGAWNSATAYNAYDTVSYQGSSYVCILVNTNILPGNTTYWNLIAQVGSTGTTGSPGNPGAVGPPGNTGATGQGYTWRGAWNSATSYVPYDTISSAGSSYVCIVPNVNQAPPNATYWNLIAQIGSQGPTGSQGPAGPSTPSANSSNLLTLGTDNFLYLADSAIKRHDYYGADTTNNNAYAVTVDSSFSLQAGIVVYVTPTNSNTGTPTLNVNGTGARTIVTRAGIALSNGELTVNKTFGVLYDGTNWRLITPIFRVYNATNPGNISIECAGYDTVRIYISLTVSQANTGFNITHLAEGAQIFVFVSNGYTATLTYTIGCSNAAGTAGTVFGMFNTSGTGVAAVNLTSTAQSLPSSTYVILQGMLIGTSAYLK